MMQALSALTDAHRGYLVEFLSVELPGLTACGAALGPRPAVLSSGDESDADADASDRASLAAVRGLACRGVRRAAAAAAPHWAHWAHWAHSSVRVSVVRVAA